jgi:3',5'-cyclic AMP phosphodiesterase CpdA
MPVKIIHLSDLHLGETLEDDENWNFNSIRGELNAKYENKENLLIIITGDIVDSGEDPKQFETAKAQIENFYKDGFTVWSIPGNHDYGRGGFIDSGGFRRFKNEIIDDNDLHNIIKDDAKYLQFRQFGGHSFFGLNSLLGDTGRFTQGNLGSDQIDDLHERLKADKKQDSERKRIVFLHNHPFHFYKKYQWGKAYYYENTLVEIRESKAFMNAIKGLANVLLFGHHHYFVNFSNSPVAREYQIDRILSCGKSTNGKGGEKEGSREFRIDRDNKVDLRSSINTGMYGWEITLNNRITVNPLTYSFDE